MNALFDSGDTVAACFQRSSVARFNNAGRSFALCIGAAVTDSVVCVAMSYPI